MSRAAKIGDAERTATMLDLVRRKYPTTGMAPSHVVIEEVSPGTGWMREQRWADVLALGVWPSRGLTLTGYEIKASRADLKRELCDLTKHEAVARYCTDWWLVGWDEKMLDVGMPIPGGWGILLTANDEHGERQLVVHRKAAQREPEQWPRPFICSMVRNAYQQSPGAHYVARAVLSATEETARQLRKLADHQHRSETTALLGELRTFMYGRDSWKWPAEAHDPKATIQDAISRLNQLALNVA